jgi:hypothetical protein
MSIPYTYLIGWSELDLWYYGVKFGKSADPAKFWVNYFTSSKYVRDMRAEFGEPDVREIRKTFESKESAAEWERKVIRRIKAVWSDKWINRGNGGHEFNPSPEMRARSKSCRQKISEARKRWAAKPENREKAIENARRAGELGASKISAKARERFADPEWKRNVHDASHQTDEHREQARERTFALFQDETYRENHLSAVRSDEYRQKKRNETIARYADPAERKRHSDILKAANASPEARAKKSEAAKASTAKRLETLRRNKELAAQAAQI